jgi:predicted dehydrogenase
MDVLRQCLRPGRTIICQKPFGRSLAEAETMADMAEAAGTVLVIHENFRFQPWHRQIRRFLDSGRMGQVYGCRFLLRPGDGRGPDAYLERQPTFQKMQKFLLRETAVHFIDLFRWLFGDISHVYADLRQLNPVIAGEDAGSLILQHAGGVRAEFDGNRLMDHVADNPRRTMGEMVIEGEGGTLTLDGFGKLRFRPFGQMEAQEIPVQDPVDDVSFGGGCVAALIRHVVAEVAAGRTPENTARSYLDVIRACDAAYLSDAEHRRVAL